MSLIYELKEICHWHSQAPCNFIFTNQEVAEMDTTNLLNIRSRKIARHTLYTIKIIKSNNVCIESLSKINEYVPIVKYIGSIFDVT